MQEDFYILFLPLYYLINVTRIEHTLIKDIT